MAIRGETRRTSALRTAASTLEQRSLAVVDVRAERPIFVVGFRRSGTTLLQSLIGSHPRIAALPETYFIFRVANRQQEYGDLGDDDNLRRALHDALDAPGGALDACGFDEAAVFERARSYDRTMRGVMSAMMDDFACREGKPRWTEKSPGQRVGAIRGLYPDAQIVQIVRDPRDVVASSLALPYLRQDAFTLAERWRDFTTANARAGLLAGPSSFLQIRYEDLSGDPEGTLRVVFAFLGEPFEAGLVADLSRRGTAITGDVPWQARVREPVQAAPEGKWRSTLGRRDAWVVQAHLHREIAMLGYERPSRRPISAGRPLVAAARLRARADARIARLRSRRATSTELLSSFLDERARNVSSASGRRRAPSASG